MSLESEVSGESLFASAAIKNKNPQYNCIEMTRADCFQIRECTRLPTISANYKTIISSV